jgi:drug/metabolite transporter (DMT)-like permease
VFFPSPPQEDDLTGQPAQTVTATAAFTAITVIAFASNSVICRMALARGTIDPAAFTSLRILSGAVTLWVVSALLRRRSRPSGSWISALILMGTVQTTMILGGIRTGERPGLLQWTGVLLAMGGIVYLTFPGLTAPPLLGSLLMAGAGIAWGIYSLRGRGSRDPVTATTDNFIRATPIALGMSLLFLGEVRWSAPGVLLALASGSIASGLGYVVWYTALRGLTATRAAVVQLSVPVIAAAGGVLLLSEAVTARLLLASVIVLGGVGLAVAGRTGDSTRKRLPEDG